MTELLSYYPVKYITNNGLTRPSTFSDYCFTPNCPNLITYGPYDSVYSDIEKYKLNLGMFIYESSRQPQLNPYISVYNSNINPIYPNYMKYKKYI